MSKPGFSLGKKWTLFVLSFFSTLMQCTHGVGICSEDECQHHTGFLVGAAAPPSSDGKCRWQDICPHLEWVRGETDVGPVAYLQIRSVDWDEIPCATGAAGLKKREEINELLHPRKGRILLYLALQPAHTRNLVLTLGELMIDPHPCRNWSVLQFHVYVRAMK